VRSDQILDHELMLGVEMFRQIDLDVCLLRYPFQLFGGLRVRLDHTLPELLRGV
jgi:hypothetical protein